MSEPIRWGNPTMYLSNGEILDTRCPKCGEHGQVVIGREAFQVICFTCNKVEKDEPRQSDS